MASNRLARLPEPLRSPRLLTAAIIVGSLALMEYSTQSGLVGALFLSPPTEVLTVLVALVQQPRVQAHIAATAWRIFAAFAIVMVLATVLSILFWQIGTLRRAYLPMLGGLFGTPIVLAYLVFVAILGRGSAAIIAIAIPLGVIPVVLSATDALMSVDRTFLQVSRTFNASSLQTFYKVIVPAAAPQVFAGVRIGFTYTVIATIGVEFLLTINVGIGGMISNDYHDFRTTRMFVGIVLIMLLVMFSIYVVRRVEEGVQR